MLLVSFGTRPEWLKIKPLIRVLKSNEYPIKVLFTGQHDSLMGEDIKYDMRLDISPGQNRLDSVVSSILNNENIFDNIDSVLVQGDTASAFALSLAAFHRKIKILHLEAGLRTYDNENPYPEEFYRRSISCMSNINFCVSEVGKNNLSHERSLGEIYVVGNTVLDNIKKRKNIYENKVLITMHRRENHDLIQEWFAMFDNIARKNKDIEFVMPIHPNPKVKSQKHLLSNVKVVEPMEHEDLLDFMSRCKLIITDSGGLQEESSFLKKKSIVCRKETERVEGLGSFSFLCKEPKHLEALFEDLKSNYEINLWRWKNFRKNLQYHKVGLS